MKYYFKKKLKIKRNTDEILVKRNKHGIPNIKAENIENAYYALGYMHAKDRGMQLLVSRIILQGRASEILNGSETLIALDESMRFINFRHKIDEDAKALMPDIRKQILAYVEGINEYFTKHRVVFELRMLGYKFETWTLEDTLMIGKAFGYIGLSQGQKTLKKLVLQLIKRKLDEKKLKELFPMIVETIPYDLLNKVKLKDFIIPNHIFSTFGGGSNAWVMSGKWTKSGKPFMCGDPHLPINRLPSIFYEAIIQLPNLTIKGATAPGISAIVIGRSDNLAWTATYSYMDIIEYHIEHCKDCKYKRGDEWKDFHIRKEIINIKKKEKKELIFFENEEGILEGDPKIEGYYALFRLSIRNPCVADDFNGLMKVPFVQDAKAAMSEFKKMNAASFNWMIADSKGSIAYQMSGRCFKKELGVSGFIPKMLWGEKCSTEYVAKDDLPCEYNPINGIIITANNDLNSYGRVNVIGACAPDYRYLRIKEILAAKRKYSISDMQLMQYDVYSLQAKAFMDIIHHLIPSTKKGRILKEWDCFYEKNSKGAMFFEKFYEEALKLTFAPYLGDDFIDYCFKDTGLLVSLFGHLDAILLNENAEWFKKSSRKNIFREAINNVLKQKITSYGESVPFTMKHLILGEKLPKICKLDFGPAPMPGGRACILQGQIFQVSGFKQTLGPAYRILVDMNEPFAYTNLPGGVSDRIYSTLYKSDIANWFKGIYKKI